MEIYLLGDKIKQAREARRMTQGELSQRVGVTQSSISKLEKGTISAAVDTLRSIAQVLGLSVDELISSNDSDRADALNRSGNPRLTIECDPTAAPGLRALAKDAGLCETMAITADEWRRLRAVPLPHTVTKSGYLQLLITLRSITGLPDDGGVTES
jgi:transcriptional regulator with XRE-family HTH domain